MKEDTRKYTQSNPHSTEDVPFIHTVSNTGTPILETIQRLMEEEIINSMDRQIIQESLYGADVKRRDEVVQAINQVDLSCIDRFSVRRLKCVIYQNSAGQPRRYIENKGGKEEKIATVSSNSSLPDSFTQIATSHLSPASVSFTSDNNDNNFNSLIKSTSTRRPRRSVELTLCDTTASFTPETTQNNKENNINYTNLSEISNHSSTPSDSSTGFLHPIVPTLPTILEDSSLKNRGMHNKDFHPPLTDRSNDPYTGRQPSLEGVSTSYHYASGKENKISRITHNSTIDPLISMIPLSSRKNNNDNGQTNVRTPRSSRKNNITENQLSGRTPRSGKNSPNKKYTGVVGIIDNLEENEDNNEYNIQENVKTVIGDSPIYTNNYDILSKITLRLLEILKSNDKKDFRNYKFAILVGSGSFNPLTRMHLRNFFLAKQHIENRLGMIVLGSLLSPSHTVTVRERYRTNINEIIPSPHRLSIAQLLVKNSKFLTIDPWEITRRRPMDYLSLLNHVRECLHNHFLTQTEILKYFSPIGDADYLSTSLDNFPIKFQIFYVCKSNQLLKLSTKTMKLNNYLCLSVCRSTESEILRGELGEKWNGLAYVVEDSAILDASLDIVTSRKVRDRMKANSSIELLVGAKIHEYSIAHRIGPKLSGLEEWSANEKEMPKIASRPAEPTLPRLMNSINNSSVHTNTNNPSTVLDSTNRKEKKKDSFYIPSWN